MRTYNLITAAVATLLMGTAFAAEDVSKSMDSLGGNRDLIRRARAMDPQNRVQVVQNRTVDRDMRFELGLNLGTVAGGDPYTKSNNFGGAVDFHVDPNWSVGARYNTYFNSLSSEGKRIADEANKGDQNGNPWGKPAIDYLKSSTLGVISFYPVYGKMNMFDMGVVQFDVYMLAGYGQVVLQSGSAPTWTAGGGFGVWLNQYVSSRFEVRYQNYKDQIYTGSRNIDAVIISAGIGFLL